MFFADIGNATEVSLKIMSWWLIKKILSQEVGSNSRGKNCVKKKGNTVNKCFLARMKNAPNSNGSTTVGRLTSWATPVNRNVAKCYSSALLLLWSSCSNHAKHACTGKWMLTWWWWWVCFNIGLSLFLKIELKECYTVYTRMAMMYTGTSL